MITIKMQANSTVTYNGMRHKTDDAILVDNYETENDIWHLRVRYSDIESYKTNTTVGCWKIKKLK